MAMATADDGGLLTEDEILKFLNEMFRIQLKKDQLAKPDGETLAKIYEIILIDFGIDEGAFRQPQQNAAHNIEDLPRYDDWFPKWNLCSTLSGTLGCIGIQDFGIRDLLSPNRKRTQRVLSQLINLWFRQQQMREKWGQIEAASESRANDKDLISEQISQLKSSCESKSVYLSQNRSNYRSLEEKLGKLVGQIEAKKTKGNDLAEESRSLKQDCANKKELISDLAVKLSEMKEDICNLEMKVVRSPEKIAAETSNKERELELTRQEKRKQTKEYIEIGKHLDVTRKAINEIRPSMDSLRDTFQEIQTLRENCAAIEKLQDQLKVKQSKLQQLRLIEKENESNLHTLKTQQKRSQYQHSTRVKPLSEGIETVKKQIEEKRGATSKSVEANRLLDEERKLINELEKVRLDRCTFKGKLEQAVARAKTNVANFRAAVIQPR